MLSRQPRDLRRSRRVILVADVVESVRLIDEDEQGIVTRWLGFLDYVQDSLLAAHGGRLVKRLGDGFIADFETVQTALAAAFAVQRANSPQNIGLANNRQILLRIGVEAADVVVDDNDIYGRGVNIAARLTALANPSEVIVSANVRDQLTAGLDADIEDLGDCFLKHIKTPVRAYRIRPPGTGSTVEPLLAEDDLFPLLAVVPYTGRDVAGDDAILGEVIAEEIIRELSHSADLHIVSRLTTTAFKGRCASAEEIAQCLNANYVLSGTYCVVGCTLIANSELVEAKSGQIVWAEQYKAQLSRLTSRNSNFISKIVSAVAANIVARELQRAEVQSLPTLENYTLLLAAVALMHRLSARSFDDAFQILRILVDRAPREAIPLAWLAKWHVLRVQQGWSLDLRRDASLALECTRRALDGSPSCSLALSIDGFVHTNLLKRLDIGLERYDLAIEVNPSEPLAWLLKGTLHAFRGDGGDSVRCTQRALKLSPLDPHRFFFDSLAATAHLAARQYERALQAAKRSLRANRTHTSTLRAMAVAQWGLAQHDEARLTCQELLRLEPSFTVSGWLARSPSSDYPIGQEWAAAFREMGAPN